MRHLFMVHSESSGQCAHCGEPCVDTVIKSEDTQFCCEGCKTVYQLLQSSQLNHYYRLNPNPGISQKKLNDTHQVYAFLDQQEIIEKLTDFRSPGHCKVRFFIPAVHCTSCVWLLEKLYELRDGIMHSELDFLRRELSVNYDPERISLRELVELLSSLGYTPDLNLEKDSKNPTNHRLLIQLGLAGFCFGNIMLFSFPEYLGLGEAYKSLFSYLNLLLGLAVLFYSSQSFFRAAWHGLKNRALNMDVPISLGILTLFGRSAFEILTGIGPGYLDAMAGLVFLLLIGRWLQERSFAHLRFERDYKAYFPIAVSRLDSEDQQSQVLLEELEVADRLLIRNGELIPADAHLISAQAQIDYRFVTGESKPILARAGEELFAGGRLLGAPIEIELSQTVSQSYLCKLWEQKIFPEKSDRAWPDLTDRLARNFTLGVLLITGMSALFWGVSSGFAAALDVATAVLIVACPCGIALTLPIIMSYAQMYLGRQGFFIKRNALIERLASISDIVFDKTGTLTQTALAAYRVVEGQLPEAYLEEIAALSRSSAHPVSQAIARGLPEPAPLALEDWIENVGLGTQATINTHNIRLEKEPLQNGTGIWVDDQKQARIETYNPLRPDLSHMLANLGSQYALHLLSGDSNKDLAMIQEIFPPDSPVHFRQSPEAKRTYINALQAKAKKVLMIGDGLNDAGALEQSDIGIAITESSGAFSPASDVILAGDALKKLPTILGFSQKSLWLVYGGLVLSLLYNLVGLGVAVSGQLSPLFAAVIMPLSSLSVILYGTLGSWMIAKSHFGDLKK